MSIPELSTPSKIAWTLYRIRHLIHSRGRSEAARLRGYYRHWVWEEQRRTYGYGHVLRYRIKSPLRAARTAYHGLSLHADGVAKRHGIPRIRQFVQLWYAKYLYNLEPKSYYLFQLYRSERWRDLDEWVQPTEIKPVYTLLARHTSEGEAGLLDNKPRFEQWCQENAIPTVTTLAHFDGGALLKGTVVDDGLPSVDLFSKPAAEWGGRGALRWEYRASGHYDNSVDKLTGPELVAHLSEVSRTQGGVLLQRALINHPTVAQCSNGALCTARLVTVFDGSSVPILEYAIFRMPFGDQRTDNFAAGGMIAPVDMVTGRLGVGMWKDPETGAAEATHHPDTGTQLEGLPLPYWTEAVETCLRGHSLLRRMPVIGWDICFLTDGPYVLEANSNPGVLFFGVAGIRIGRSRWLQQINQHAERVFGPGGAPPESWF